MEELGREANAGADADCHGVEADNSREDCKHWAVVAEEGAKIRHRDTLSNQSVARNPEGQGG